MAVAYSALTHSGLLSQHYPPPLLPKPGKDNVRLQKLLKRTAKKKASTQATQSAAPFRSSLSPVNEASADLEHSDHSTPPRTPETKTSFYGVQQAPRFSARPLYQHVASPYPQRAAFGRPARFSPQTVAVPSYSQQLYSAAASYSGVSQSMAPQISLLESSVPTITVSAAEVKKPRLSTFDEPHVGLTPTAAAVATPRTKPTSPGLSPYSGGAGQDFTRSLTVMTPLIRAKSPRPTFRATQHSRSPKTLFDVPQIRMYTASTSYYETSRTPPVYDTTELTAIANTAPLIKIQTEATEEAIATAGIYAATSSPAELKTTTPTTEIKSVTPSEIKRATPTVEVTFKAPSYEFQSSRTFQGRPRTPAYHVSRATTPVFEISKPNPLLFALSPVTVEPERSQSPKVDVATSSLSASDSATAAQSKPTHTETIPNGDIPSVVIHGPKPTQHILTKAKSESCLTKYENQAAYADAQRSKTPTFELTALDVSSYSSQGRKTPTYEASRLLTTSLGYKRPKTPTGVSPVGFQRPKTPTQVASKTKSTYRGLTPAEYAAYGGIKTYAPAFGISSTKTEEEVVVAKEESQEIKTPMPEPPMKAPSIFEVPQVKETPKDVAKPQKRDEKVSTTHSIPTIVVSQASDTLMAVSTQETVTVKQEKILLPETPKTKTPTTDVKILAKEETPSQKAVQTTPSETKQPPPKVGDPDPFKAVRKLFGKDKTQTAEQKAVPVAKIEVSEPKEPVKPVPFTSTEETKSNAAAPTLPVKEPPSESKASTDQAQDKKGEPEVKTEPQKREGDESLPAAEPLLKAMLKPKGMKSKLSGWSRLKKHMVVEQEEPKFPETTGQDRGEAEKTEEKADDTAGSQDKSKAKGTVGMMWDAVLFQMFSTKENIMHQIELNKSDEEKKTETQDALKEIPAFAHRLPLLLFSPRFDAKKLREAASRPATKISTVFEMGLIGRKVKDEEPKDFNRTARGFTAP